MNAKSTISALCLCLMGGSANAAIVDYFFYANQAVQAVSYLNPTVVNDFQASNPPLSAATSYGNTITAHATDSIILDEVTYDLFASASSSLAINADIDAGVFSGWGNFQTSASGLGYMLGYGSTSSQIGFLTTTPYAFTLDVTASPGANRWEFSSQHRYFSDYGQNDLEGLNIHLSGIFLPNEYVNLYVGVIGDTSPSYYPSGDFQYTLTLTPVPEPEAWGLMLSGLGLVGWAARRRKQAQI